MPHQSLGRLHGGEEKRVTYDVERRSQDAEGLWEDLYRQMAADDPRYVLADQYAESIQQHILKGAGNSPPRAEG